MSPPAGSSVRTLPPAVGSMGENSTDMRVGHPGNYIRLGDQLPRQLPRPVHPRLEAHRPQALPTPRASPGPRSRPRPRPATRVGTPPRASPDEAAQAARPRDRLGHRAAAGIPRAYEQDVPLQAACGTSRSSDAPISVTSYPPSTRRRIVVDARPYLVRPSSITHAIPASASVILSMLRRRQVAVRAPIPSPRVAPRPTGV